MKKEDARKQKRDTLLKRRKQVIGLHQEGVPIMQIVERSGLSWSAVNAAIKLYKSGGEAALEPAVRGRKQGTDRALSQAQETKIHRLICGRRPWQCQFKGRHLWDRSLVKQLIEKKCGKKLSVRGVDKYLERWMLVLKDQKKRPYARCNRMIKKWLDENYSAIEQKAIEEKAKIYWINRTQVIYPDNVKLDKHRPRLYMFTVATNQGKMRTPGWLVIKSKFSTKRQISFLKALIKSAQKKVYLISETPKIDFTRETMEWIQNKCKEMIEIFSKKPYPHRERVYSKRERENKKGWDPGDLWGGSDW